MTLAGYSTGRRARTGFCAERPKKCLPDPMVIVPRVIVLRASEWARSHPNSLRVRERAIPMDAIPVVQILFAVLIAIGLYLTYVGWPAGERGSSAAIRPALIAPRKVIQSRSL